MHGPVERDDVARRSDQSEAELVLELQEGVARIHDPIRPCSSTLVH